MESYSANPDYKLSDSDRIKKLVAQQRLDGAEIQRLTQALKNADGERNRFRQQMLRDAPIVARLEAENARLSAELLKLTSDRHDDLKRLLQALGMYDGATPASPAEVFEAAIKRAKFFSEQFDSQGHDILRLAFDKADAQAKVARLSERVRELEEVLKRIEMYASDDGRAEQWNPDDGYLALLDWIADETRQALTPSKSEGAVSQRTGEDSDG